MKRLTFKKTPRPTGLASVAYTDSTEIKCNGKVVGMMYAPSLYSKQKGWALQFAIMKTEPDGNPNCDWKWVIMTHRPDNEADARAWVIKRWEALLGKYNFKQHGSNV